MELSLRDYIDGVRNGSLDMKSVVEHYFQKAKNDQGQSNAFVRFHDLPVDYGSFENTKLLGAPIAIKDNILQKGYISSCSSRMMENYVAPYNATCMEKLLGSGAVSMGKTNMDEYAMGSSNETSYFGAVKNPHGTNRIPGGSSGGSAVAVAGDLCLGALGTDTGGSVRQPASLCGVVGLKPTYGRVSRYGVQSMASSLDQVGTITKTVADARLLLSCIEGWDDKDGMSNEKMKTLSMEKSDLNNKKYRLALPKQFLGEGLEDSVRNRFMEVVEKLKSLGHTVEEVDLPILKYSVPIYYILMPAEVSTNLARFDGIRFGHQDDTMKYDDMNDYFDAVRSEGFGPEAIRRILLGTFVLSSANYEGFYARANKARAQLISDFDRIFADYDFIVSPTSPEVAWKIGEKSDDPLKMYLADLYTIPANLAGIPAISIPIGKVEDRGEMMPVGLQLMGKAWSESELLDMGEVVEGV